MLTPADTNATPIAVQPFPEEAQVDPETESYELDSLDGTYSVLLDRQYQARRAEIVALFQLLSSTATARRMLDEIRQLASHDVVLAIGPMAGVQDDAMRAEATDAAGLGVGQTRHGQPLWDCFHVAGLTCGNSAYSLPYPRLIEELTVVRNVAMAKVWPDIAPIGPRDMEAAFMAELAVRATPAFANPIFWPVDFRYVDLLDPQRTPAWRDPLTFDTLHGIVPAWMTPQAAQYRDEIVDLLRCVYLTPVGERLMNELCVYARSNAMMVIHHSRHGRDGVYAAREGDRTPVWCFNRTALEAGGQAPGLSPREARASGAFLALLSVRHYLTSKLGLLVTEEPSDPLMEVFRQQLHTSRQDRGAIRWVDTVVLSPHRAGHPQATTPSASVRNAPHSSQRTGDAATRPSVLAGVVRRARHALGLTMDRQIPVASDAARSTSGAQAGPQPRENTTPSTGLPSHEAPRRARPNEYAPDPLRERNG